MAAPGLNPETDMLATQAPFSQYFDADGSPLDAGNVYFGQAGQNPLTSPVAVYWDFAGTQPAAQPVRTLNGYTMRSGTPAAVFASGDYSVLVTDRRGRQIVYCQSAAALDNSIYLQAQITAVDTNIRADLSSTSDAAKGPGQVGFNYALNYAANTIGWAVQKMQVNAAWFGAKFDGVTDDIAALEAAQAFLNLNTFSSPTMNYNQGGGILILPRGVGMVSRTFYLAPHVILQGQGSKTYQSNFDGTPPDDGSTIMATAGFVGVAVIDSAGYVMATGQRYAAEALKTPADYIGNLVSYTEGCGLRDVGVLRGTSGAKVGVRIMGSPGAKLYNVSAYDFPTNMIVASSFNCEVRNLSLLNYQQIGLVLFNCNICDISGSIDGSVFLGVGNGVTAINKPTWWDAIDTVYASTAIYMVSCNAITFGALSTQHGARGLYANKSNWSTDVWYCEDFSPTITSDPSYITGSALICANNGSVSTTPSATTAGSIGVIQMLFSDSNGVTVADSIYNSNVTVMGFAQTSGGAGVGILYGSHTSTGQQLYLGAGVLRNSAFPDIAYDNRLTYVFDTEGTWTPAPTNLGGTGITYSTRWIKSGTRYDCQVTINGTNLTATAGSTILSTPFNGSAGFGAPARNSPAVVANAAMSALGSGMLKTDANLYLPTIAATSQIVISFSVFTT